MVSLPKDFFAKKIKIGNIYLIIKHKLKSTKDPHYFIVIGKSDNELVLFSCCTKKFETVQRLIELNGSPESTLVWIKPDENNKLSKNTYINCNSVFPYTLDELYALSEKGLFKYAGSLSEGKLEEIKTGINDSPNVEGEYKDIVNGNGSEE